MKKDALAVMLKVPKEGGVKTRLCPPLSAKDACLLYEAFLKDLFARLKELKDIDIHVFYAFANGLQATPEPSGLTDNLHPVLTSISKLFPLTPQKDGDLGDKIKGVFKNLFALGYERAAIIGSDSPDIPLVNIRHAFASVDATAPRLAFGPALDGGYYLIAMNRVLQDSCAPIFNGVKWGASSVLCQSLERAAQAAIPVALLPRWHDIDRFEDLSFIKDNLELPSTMAALNVLKINL